MKGAGSSSSSSSTDSTQTGTTDATPTGVAEAFAALLAGIVATPVAPAPVATGGKTAAATTTKAADTTTTSTGKSAPVTTATTTTAPAAAGDLLTATPAITTTVPAPSSPHAPAAAAATATGDATLTATPTPAAQAPVPATPPAPAAPAKDDKATAPTIDATALANAAAAAAPVVTAQATTQAQGKETSSKVTAAPATGTVTAPAVAVAATTTSDSSGAKSGSGTTDGQTTADQQPAPAPAAPVVAAVDPSGTTTAIVPSTPIVQGPVAAMQAAPQPIVVPVATAVPQSLTVDRERFAQMVESLETRLRVSGAEGGKAMRMTLSPPELGGLSVRLHIAADGQSATASLVAQHHETGDMLAQAAGDLQKALADRGLRLDRLDVTAGGSSSSLGADTRPDGAPSNAPNPREQQSRRTTYTFDMGGDAAPTGDGSSASDTPGTTPTSQGGGLYVLA